MSAKKQKTLECFSFQNGGYRVPKSSPRKVRENSGKIQLNRKNNRHSVPSSPTVFVAVNVERQRRKNYWRTSAKIRSPPLFFQDMSGNLWAEIS